MSGQRIHSQVNLSEQFIPDHVFVYVRAGGLYCYDGHRSHLFRAGNCFLVRKNRLAKYQREQSDEELMYTAMCFDEPFLRDYQERHKAAIQQVGPTDAFIPLHATGLILQFIQSLKPAHSASGALPEAFEDAKYEPLLGILLREQPLLAGILFDFSPPHKTELEAFMNRSYRFNVSNARFAYLTGRSLSAFKRDFRSVFNTTPGQWLMRKRLEEAHLLIQKGGKKPAEIYVDLGFEDLSHFSFAFRKRFGYTPTDARMQKAGHIIHSSVSNL